VRSGMMTDARAEACVPLLIGRACPTAGVLVVWPCGKGSSVGDEERGSRSRVHVRLRRLARAEAFREVAGKRWRTAPRQSYGNSVVEPRFSTPSRQGNHPGKASPAAEKDLGTGNSRGTGWGTSITRPRRG
jgi:hypothetical protein